jgi:hypothetical protein
MYNLQVMTVQSNIREVFGVNQQTGINEGNGITFYFTPYAGNLDITYRDEFGRRMDFEVTNVTFPNDPFIPRITAIHIMDDPRNPNNVITVSFDFLEQRMIDNYDLDNNIRFGKKQIKIKIKKVKNKMV